VPTRPERPSAARVTYEPPTIAVVTPSYEMAEFLGETIESVLGQDWPYVDYLVMDGGSRDGTRELLGSYGDRIRWVSEPDGGQADAVNGGFARTRGDLFTFLNADDVLRPGALRAAAAGFERNPGAGTVYGDADYVDGHGTTVRPYPVRDFDRERLMHECFICQPAAFVRRAAWEDCGGLDVTLHYALDYDLWIRMSERWRLVRIPGTLATSRMHAGNKTLGQRKRLYRESMAVAKRHFGYVSMTWIEQYARRLVDRVDQFYEHSIPSRRSRAVALALGARHNAGQLARFWRDWQSDGLAEPFEDGWMSKACRVRVSAPGGPATLAIAGRHHARVRRPLILGVSVDGQRLGRVAMRHNGSFERRFELPHMDAGEHEVEIVSAWTWRPGTRRGDTRRLSCLLDRVELAERLRD
jgi:glycosyltransferase involved in cell wall biosynthesis